MFFFVNEVVTATASALPDLSLRLFLNAAQAADEFAYSAIAYEFFKEALLIYEGEVSDSKQQVQALKVIIGSLLPCKNFPTEDYEALITKVAQVSFTFDDHKYLFCLYFTNLPFEISILINC